jgi:hypothetical protein
MAKVRIVNMKTGQARYVSSVTAGKTAFLRSMGFEVQDLPAKLELEKEPESILNEPKNEAKPRKTRTPRAPKSTN